MNMYYYASYSDSDGWYVPTAVTFGKIPVDPDENVLYQEKRSTKMPVEEVPADEVRLKYIDR
ncbi:MAG: hypothetical protein LBN22_03350 [Clostridiales Family XIII bacterium]|nr:hypothetical protein [Clostridiales Family XIII bacterium]